MDLGGLNKRAAPEKGRFALSLLGPPGGDSAKCVFFGSKALNSLAPPEEAQVDLDGPRWS